MNITISGILSLLIIFSVKIIENMLDATKIIMLQRGRHVISGMILFVGLMISYTITKKIVSSGSEVLIVAAAGGGIGYTLAGFVGDRFFHSPSIEPIMNENREAIKATNSFLTEQHIKHLTVDVYDKDMAEKTPAILAFPKTKAKQQNIEKYLKDSDSKFGHMVIG